MSNLCPCCGQPYSAAADLPAPEFVRSVDAKGRLTLPAEVIQTHGTRYRAILDGRIVRLQAGWDGKLAQPAFKARKSGSRRYLIPADLRQLAGIWSSRNAAIRRVGREVLVWRL
jgi:DNA-binding transcriptional regulator/RsmH inhibitor MraZ